jgi:DNA polymerase III delta subunit
MIDSVIEGNLRQSLDLLDRQLVAGENPSKLVIMMTGTIRKLALAARRILAGEATDSALAAAGILPFKLAAGRTQLRHLGRARLRELYRILLTADAAIKGETSLPPRVVLERLLITLGRPAALPGERGA